MLFLLRYDTERRDAESMAGFFERTIEVQRQHEIPATFFCTGGAIDAREADFRMFADEVRGDALFDIQDHSYTHIGIGYEAGKPVDVLREDYERSLAAHERVCGARPTGMSICGTSGADGDRLHGFDETDKSRAELDMLVDLGFRMVNSFLVGQAESKTFVNYATLGHPDVMGYPSAYSDTGWMHRAKKGDPIEFILGEISARAERREHMPLMLHDWVAWLHAGDQDLSHVVKIVDHARNLGYECVSHIACYDRPDLWR